MSNESIIKPVILLTWGGRDGGFFAFHTERYEHNLESFVCPVRFVRTHLKELVVSFRAGRR
jgi:hypothetical protein